jgi:hypothetical protein
MVHLAVAEPVLSMTPVPTGALLSERTTLRLKTDPGTGAFTRIPQNPNPFGGAGAACTMVLDSIVPGPVAAE